MDLENEKILKFFSPVVKILQSIRDNISVILRKWEVLLRIKKSQWVSCLLKINKQELKNYILISLLPLSDKIFGWLLYDRMFRFFSENSLTLQKQSGFKPGDSCPNQLVLNLCQIHKSFDDDHELQSVFLHISKAFDKVWHEGLTFKLKKNGISSNLLDTLTGFLKLRKQRVVLNGQLSSWSTIESGVPQGYILSQLCYFWSP